MEEQPLFLKAFPVFFTGIITVLLAVYAPDVFYMGRRSRTNILVKTFGERAVRAFYLCLGIFATVMGFLLAFEFIG